MDLLAQGAEAKLFRDKDKVIKERIAKGYRHHDIDLGLRRFRTRREAKVLQKLDDMQFPAPKFHDFCDKRMTITMDFVEGPVLRDVLSSKAQVPQDEYQELAQRVGKQIGQFHMNDIIHGDLTTSNMILEGHMNKTNSTLKFIDFGLSKFSDKAEDKAVDLHLLDRALESTHSDLYPQIFKDALEAYKKANPNAAKVLERLSKVQKRGRHKK